MLRLKNMLLYYAVLKSTISFEYFQKEKEPHSPSISGVIDSKRLN